MSSITTLPVRGESPYDVLVGEGAVGGLLEMIGDVQRVALLYAADLAELAQPVLETLRPHYDVLGLGLPDGEQAKTLNTVAACWDALGEAGFTRSDVVVTFGGGATTDAGGYVAAAWLRGVRVIHVPTTVLAMVDAAVGGKTGINTATGKNLVGAFHEPGGVICDLDFLATLPEPELKAGLGEVVKCGFIADSGILELIAAGLPSGEVLRELIERAIRVKIDVVVDDLLETGGRDGHPGREVLNYGHTLAHAIEKATNYSVRHGEAVAIGCVYAAELAAREGLLPAEVVDQHRTAFSAVGLPTGYSGAPFDELLATMRVDKKARGNELRFLVLHAVNLPRILTGPSEENLRAAFAAIGGDG